MENFRKVALGFTLLFAVIAGVRVYFIHRERVEANATPAPQIIDYHTTDDDLVVPRKIYPATLADARALDGKSVWVSGGDQVQFYPDNGGHIDFAHPGGYLLGADQLEVKQFTLAVAPKSAQSRIPTGDRQVFMVFARPGDDHKLFAAPIGYEDATGFTFYLDTLFFYDDPHTLYKHWPQSVWDAIAQHKAILGMSENQVELALGEVATTRGTEKGNRTIKYYNIDKPFNVTFEDNKATKIEPTAF